MLLPLRILSKTLKLLDRSTSFPKNTAPCSGK